MFFLGFKGLYPDTDPLSHLTDNDCLPLGDSSLLTPIDRLYSMQNSYFTSWEGFSWGVGHTSLIHSASLYPVLFSHRFIQEITTRKVCVHCDNMQ